MKTSVVASTALLACGLISLPAHAKGNPIISKEKAIQAALSAIGVEVLGIRYDEPDSQWDVFVKSGQQAYEVEIDAQTANIIVVEAESLEEVQAELSGNLSHEGVEGDVDKQ